MLRPRELPLGGGGGFGLFFCSVTLLCCLDRLVGFVGIISGTFSFLSVCGLDSSGCLSVPFFLDFLGGGRGADLAL